MLELRIGRWIPEDSIRYKTGTAFRRERKKTGEVLVKDLLTLDRMVTPKVITFVYWLMLLGIGIAALINLIAAFAMMGNSVLAGLGMLILIPIGVALAALAVRIYCEVMIVLFRILDALVAIRDRP